MHADCVTPPRSPKSPPPLRRRGHPDIGANACGPAPAAVTRDLRHESTPSESAVGYNQIDRVCGFADQVRCSIPGVSIDGGVREFDGMSVAGADGAVQHLFDTACGMAV